MSKNFIQPGKVLDIVVPVGAGDLKSGDPFLIGALKSAIAGQDSALAGGTFGVIQADVKEGEDGTLAIWGVWELPKDENEAIVQWAELFFDDVNKRLTAVKNNSFKRVGIALLAAPAGSGNDKVTVALRPDGAESSNVLIVDHVTTAARTAGTPFLLQQGADRMLAIPLKDAAGAGENIPILVNGPVQLEKAAVGISVYEKAFWDDGASKVTNASAAGLVEIGYFLAAQIAGDAFAYVRLKDDFVTPVP